METPQLEKGFVRIANDIAKELAKTYLSSYESQILWCLFLKTYGFNKKDDWISNSQFVVMTNIHKAHVSRTIKKLIARNIVTQIGNKISFQKDSRLWRKLPKQVTVTQIGNPVTHLGQKVTQMGTTVTQIGGHNRHLYKRQYTKDTLQQTTYVENKKLIDRMVTWAYTRARVNPSCSKESFINSVVAAIERSDILKVTQVFGDQDNAIEFLQDIKTL